MRWRDRTVWVVLPAVVVAVAAVSALGPIRDVDSYWHVLLGREMWHAHRVHDLGLAWTYGPVRDNWSTTMWLSEIGMAGLEHTFGWAGLTVARFVLLMALAVLLGRELLSDGGQRDEAARGAVFAAVLLAAAADAADRPALASFLFLTVLAGRLHRMRTLSVAPGLLSVGVFTAVWANIHGYWVLVPVCFVLAGVSAAADVPGGIRFRAGAARVYAVRAAVALVAGCVTPVGPALLLSPFRVQAATATISEWQRTSIRGFSGLVLMMVVAGCALAWAVSVQRPGLGEPLFVLALFGFGVLAFRNATPALLLMAPVVASRAAEAFPGRERPAAGPGIRALAAALMIGSVAGAAGVLLSQDPLRGVLPRASLAVLAGEPGERRVLNDYNVGGKIVAFSGPRVRVAVDGRADLYGGPWLAEYKRMQAGQPGWDETLARLAPTDAVLRTDQALAGLLRGRGWTVTADDGLWVLLLAPSPQQ